MPYPIFKSINISPLHFLIETLPLLILIVVYNAVLDLIEEMEFRQRHERLISVGVEA